MGVMDLHPIAGQEGNRVRAFRGKILNQRGARGRKTLRQGQINIQGSRSVERVFLEGGGGNAKGKGWVKKQGGGSNFVCGVERDLNNREEENIYGAGPKKGPQCMGGKQETPCLNGKGTLRP